ncbi:hypothetical protein FCV25MIE_07210 [Fagus crenata]
MQLCEILQQLEGLNFPALTENQRAELDRLVSQEEIEAAVFQLGPTKASGSDGLHCLLSKILGGSETCIHSKDSSLLPFRCSNSLAENQLNRMTQSRVGRAKLERSLMDWQILMTVKGVWKRGRLWSGTGFVAKSTTGTKKVGGCINFKPCSRKVA